MCTPARRTLELCAAPADSNCASSHGTVVKTSFRARDDSYAVGVYVQRIAFSIGHRGRCGHNKRNAGALAATCFEIESLHCFEGGLQALRHFAGHTVSANGRLAVNGEDAGYEGNLRGPGNE